MGTAARRRSRQTIDRVSASIGIVALLGLIQYIFAIDITQYLAVPGLHAKKLAADFQFRYDLFTPGV